MDASRTGRRLAGTGYLAGVAAARRAAATLTGAAVGPVAPAAPAVNDTRRHGDPAAHTGPRVMLQAVDMVTGRVLWQMPLDAFAALSGDPARDDIPRPPTAAYLPGMEHARSQDAGGAASDAPAGGARAYARDEDEPAGAPAFSRKA